ncbi:sugar phosphate isomerase/epimerase family protein [Rhodoligotrophos defluvii]|uniref:sugar phosphate isomerase/epimerase family protein n=1 Tax=Rhodoligotrophos defluvii TaxID=2561934 RepID=UPI0010CA1B23|nr:sugar phosphate isomerase/epimerase [Rhodoligotrophos defluvii]
MNRNRLSFNTGNLAGTLSEKLAALEAAGFTATTMWPADFFGRFEDIGTNFDAARSSRLRPTCYMMMRTFEGIPAAMKPQKLELARQMMDQMALIGATTLVQTSNVSAHVEKDWARAVEDFQALAEIARARNVRVAFEPLSQGPWINTYMLGWQLVKDVDHPNFGLVLDASHVFLAESPLDEIDQIPGDRIFLCEVSDFPAANLPPREMLRNYRLFPGEGVKPVRSFVERVMGTGYEGDFSAEVFNAYYRTLDPAVVARRGFDSLEKLFAKELGL